jgi:uncharacterized protein YegP (UPF0339 family)
VKAKGRIISNLGDRKTDPGNEDTVTIYRAADGEYYWHRQAFGNNKTLCDGSEGYSTVDDAHVDVIRCCRGPYRLVVEG